MGKYNWTPQSDIDWKNNISKLIEYNIENNIPYSLVRTMEGELSVLEQEIIHPIEYINNTFGYSNGYGYCGVKVPNIPMRDRMIEAIKHADHVGILHGDPRFDILYDKINFWPKNTISWNLCLYLPMRKDFVALLKKYPPLLVGRKSAYYAERLKKLLNIDVPGVVNLEDVRYMDEAISQMLQIEHSWSMVCAGAPAVVVAAEMAYKYGKVSLDSGHIWDNSFCNTDPETGKKLDWQWAEWYLNTEE
jgi:hypothetical protein